MNTTVWQTLASQEIRPNPTGPVARFHTDEGGMLSLVSMVTMLMFLVLLSLMANVGAAVNDKITAQNAADAAAYTATVEMARGMNAVTATNHLMGEMISFVVIHRAIGGPELEKNNGKGERPRGVSFIVTLNEDILLMVAYWGAKIVNVFPGRLGSAQKFDPYLYDKSLGMNTGGMKYDVKDTVKCGGMSGTGKLKIKTALSLIYATKAKAAILCGFKPVPKVGPILDAAGLAIGMIAHALEKLCEAEWRVLTIFEKMARNKALWSVRNALYNWMAPNAYSYMKFVTNTSGMQAGRAVAAISELNGNPAFKGTTWPIPQILEIPVRAEPFPDSEADDGTYACLPDKYKPEGMVPKSYPSVGAASSERQNQTNSSRGTGTARNNGDSSFGSDTGEAWEVENPLSLMFFLKTLPFGANHNHQVPEFNHDYNNNTASANGRWRKVSANVSKNEFPEKQIWRSQMAMATYPWVMYDRAPILLFTSWMVISNASGLYLYYTNSFAMERIARLCTRGKSGKGQAKQGNTNPALCFIMKESSCVFKGWESWTGKSAPTTSGNVADNRKYQASSFLNARGFVHRPAPVPYSSRIYSRQNPTVGQFAYAQAMIYNANTQNPPRKVETPGGFFGPSALRPAHQPDIAYDTLNWTPRISSSNSSVRMFSGYGCSAAHIPVAAAISAANSGFGLPSSAPKVRLNWQNRLSPVRTEMAGVFAAPWLLPKGIDDAFKRSFPFPFVSGTTPSLSQLTHMDSPVPPSLENH